jgi:hypothetical protein
MACPTRPAEERAHEARRLDQPRVAEAVIVAVRADVPSTRRRKYEDRAAVREVLRGEEFLREDRRAAPDRVAEIGFPRCRPPSPSVVQSPWGAACRKKSLTPITDWPRGEWPR